MQHLDAEELEELFLQAQAQIRGLAPVQDLIVLDGKERMPARSVRVFRRGEFDGLNGLIEVNRLDPYQEFSVAASTAAQLRVDAWGRAAGNNWQRVPLRTGLPAGWALFQAKSADPSISAPQEFSVLHSELSQFCFDALSNSPWIPFESAFPNDQYGITFGLELPHRAFIAISIGLNFRRPVGFVLVGFSIAARASMPKAAMHEDAQVMLRKPKIGPAGQIRMTSPADNAFLFQRLSKRYLSGFVAFASNSPHHIRAFSFGEHVHALCELQAQQRSHIRYSAFHQKMLAPQIALGCDNLFYRT